MTDGAVRKRTYRDGVKIMRQIPVNIQRRIVDPRPVIDVASTSIPRKTVLESMRSLVGTMEDRSDWRLRWIYHLCYSFVPDLDLAWHETLAQANEAAKLFDEVLIIAEQRNYRYCESIYRTLQHVERTVLWVEDDKRWLKPWSMRRALEIDADIVVFMQRSRSRMARGKTPADVPDGPSFTTTPSVWHPVMRDWLLHNFPSDRVHLTECDMMLLAMRSSLRRKVYPESDVIEDFGSYGGFGPGFAWYDDETNSMHRVLRVIPEEGENVVCK